ncbi:MAG: hypothetical protein A2X93_02215 [Deltaproteobacteria bacterium GWC2_56_8]|nr:MAG: hypothetical protein A2X99_00365 [Deltaproteobacteria bacterium GWB2_55_19]OGP34179.1 MAG: hypothetical protein A2X93_02215 [Deltaproteobacteria bacterium GWC2_56_8]
MADKTVDFFVELINECKAKKGERSSRFIYNADIEHAKVAVEALFNVAIEDEKDVYIVSDTLRKDFYSDPRLVAKVKTLLNNQHNVEIIVLDPEADLTKHVFAKVVRENEKYGKIFLGDQKHSAPHFTLVGDSAFRLETDHNQTKATICFNNKSIGSCLLAEFNRLKKVFPPEPVANN